VQMLKPRTVDEAVGRWPGILQSLGIESRYLSKKHGPCPVCQGKDRYRFDDKNGRGTWICSHCGAGDGFALLRKVFGWSFADAAKQVDRIVGTVQPGAITQERSEESKLQALRAAWVASKPVTKGDPVWKYLNRRLGIDLVPEDIRYHPGMKHSEGGTYPVMLSTMRYPDGSAASVHRTYLTPDGEKAPVQAVKKFMAGKPLNSSSVWLSGVGPRIGIAEGIETALAASLRFLTPVWAATNATLLEGWVPPAGVKEVLIAGDNDASYTGQAAAFALARRLIRDGYAVEIQIPGTEGKDWADEGI
jgi:putative DNA primase/helicase